MYGTGVICATSVHVLFVGQEHGNRFMACVLLMSAPCCDTVRAVRSEPN